MTTAILIIAILYAAALLLTFALCHASAQGSRDSEWFCVSVDQEARQKRRVEP